MAAWTLWSALALAFLTACGKGGTGSGDPSGTAGVGADRAGAGAPDANTGGTGAAVADGDDAWLERPTAGAGGQAIEGTNGLATEGTEGPATGGSNGQATEGTAGQATEGSNEEGAAGSTGQAAGGTAGQANEGTAGQATEGTAGQATGGSNGQATGGSNGQATGGTAGQANEGTAGQAAGGSNGQTTGGSNGQATGGSNGQATGGAGGSGEDCRNIQCLRPYECVRACGDEEVLNNGCCPCPSGMIDSIQCPTPAVTQGVSGAVLWLEGNHMPGAGGSSSGITEPVSREVRVYAAVSASEVVEATDRPDAYGVYDTITATLLQATTSDTETGYYEVALDPGTYSIFVEDGGDWYCNRTSAAGLCTVTVEAGAVTSYEIRIDYAAAY